MDDFSYRYINKQIEAAYIGYTLIIEYRGRVYRFEKKFRPAYQNVDDEFLYQEAVKQVSIIDSGILEVVDGGTNQ